jgi:hypothetical protein
MFLHERTIAHGEGYAVKSVCPHEMVTCLTAWACCRPRAAGDLATRNVLVDNASGCVVCDFDLATWNGSLLKDYAMNIPTRWAAPEVPWALLPLPIEAHSI